MRYIVFVLISPDVSDIDKAVECVMAPFDYSSEGQEQEQVCRCVGRQAREEAEKYAKKVCDDAWERGDVDEWSGASDRQIELSRKRPLSKAEEIELDGLAAECEQKFAEGEELYNRPYYDALSTHPLLHEPDVNCGLCDGSGRCVGYKRAHAPLWMMGWGHIFTAVAYSFLEQYEPKWKSERLREKYTRIQTQEHTNNFRRSVIAVRDIPENWPIPRAVVVDGAWCESSEGTFSLPMRENALAKKEWERTYHQLLKEHPDSLAVVCVVDTENDY